MEENLWIWGTPVVIERPNSCTLNYFHTINNYFLILQSPLDDLTVYKFIRSFVQEKGGVKNLLIN